MRKILAVIRREFRERVRSKWFWVMTVLGPVFFGAIFLIPIILGNQGGVKRVVVVDRSRDGVGAGIADALNGSKLFVATRLVPGPATEDSLTAAVGAKRLDGFLLVSDATSDSGYAEYRASNVSAIVAIEQLRATLGQVATAARLERAGVNPAVVSASRVTGKLDTKKIAGGRATSESAAQSFSLAYFMGFILYLAILIYGINVQSSVLEEKTSRVVEVLVSSLRPFQLMAGKVIGVGAVSLFQFVIWGLSARWLIRQRAHFLAGNPMAASGSPFAIPHVSPATAVVFGAYFIGGFLLYSAMFAAVGAMSSNEQEARQAQQPVSWLLVIAFLGMFAMLNDPGSPFAVALSLIPFTAPIAMPVRWVAGNLPWADVAVSLAILAVSIVAVTWVAARIYRVGILMTGKRPGLRELVRWVRTA